MANGKTVLVTGGSSGIGRAVVLKLSQLGYRVAYTYRSQQHNQETQTMLSEHGLTAQAIPCDLSDIESADSLIVDLFCEWGVIDALVCSAGISNTKSLEEIDEAEWDRMINTNLKATFFIIKQVFIGMKKKGSGKIVCVTSIAGDRGAHYSGVHYAASKAGISAIVKSLALQGAAHGITVNSVSPGIVDTPMAKEENLSFSDIPMGRAAYPQEIAESVSFLISDQANYITGATMDINGGMMMR